MNWPVLADAIVQFSVPGFEYPRDGTPVDAIHYAGPVSRPLPTDQPKPDWWPALEGLASNDDVLLVVSAGGRDVSTLPELPANARAASFLPYDELLPRTDVMVTNGGYGGVHYPWRTASRWSSRGRRRTRSR